VGDAFDGVPLTRTDDRFELVTYDSETAISALFTLALVVGVYEGYVVFAPVTTRGDVTNRANYATLVASGRRHEKWARLPPLPRGWEDDAIVALFLPGTLPLSLAEQLRRHRLASMVKQAQATLRRRFSRAWEG
jgi:hypothetical protein